ncbi:WecB/TagA/CpsF family glycosyltransferase [candidate division WOR-3 bacterium]|nr:WecB/TagA/CpsF family glycosyltransferase [candidate division WOR-3 bacterium]
MGTPKKQYFIRDNFENLDVTVVMGVGGSFDVFAGLKKEAPSWLRKGFVWILNRLSLC